MQQFLTAASPFCVYDEWCTRCKSRDTCPDIPVWLKNGVSSHSYIGHCIKASDLGHNHSGRTGHGVKHLVTILQSWYRNAYSGILFFDSKTVRKLMQCEMTELFVAQVTSRELLLRKPRKYITRLLSLQIAHPALMHHHIILPGQISISAFGTRYKHCLIHRERSLSVINANINEYRSLSIVEHFSQNGGSLRSF